MIRPLAKPTRAERVIKRSERKRAGRSATTLNPSGLAHAKPQVWHCTEYRTWAVKRYDCGIKGRFDHVCTRSEGKTLKQAAHPEPEGKGLKASDHRIVVLCSAAHSLQHSIGWQSFQDRYDFDRDATARAIFESSPWASRVEVSW